MKKAELIHRIKPVGISVVATESMLTALAEAIQEALVNGEEINLPGIGKFMVKHRLARRGRNPRTGESIVIPAKKLPRFVAAKALKDKVA